MRIIRYIEGPVTSLLDVGCNVGLGLKDYALAYPSANLAGVELNCTALEQARANVPTADLRHASAESLPFPDGSFQYVTCTEVLEHLPADLRATACREMRRVLAPQGKLILTVPHAGWFAWMDSNNMRFRLPRLYHRLIGQGRRDATYDRLQRIVEWHHHFTLKELEQITGNGLVELAFLPFRLLRAPCSPCL